MALVGVTRAISSQPPLGVNLSDPLGHAGSAVSRLINSSPQAVLWMCAPIYTFRYIFIYILSLKKHTTVLSGHAVFPW